MGRMHAAATTRSGRHVITPVKAEIIHERYGPTRTYNNINCGGSQLVVAILGPDLGDGRKRGSSTASGKSLSRVISGLNRTSPGRSWVAGHLLNGEWGGSGTDPKNLTPLTSEANSNHETFEGHIKNLLVVCNQIDNDQNSAALAYWYAVEYKVEVSATTFAQTPAHDDWHSYAYSHITIKYRVVTVDKQTKAVAHAIPIDGFSGRFGNVAQPASQGAPAVVVGAGTFPFRFGPHQIHNE